MRTKTVLTETLDSIPGGASVNVKIVNGVVDDITITWYANGIWWTKSIRIPTVQQLDELHTALVEILTDPNERGLLPPESEEAT